MFKLNRRDLVVTVSAVALLAMSAGLSAPGFGKGERVRPLYAVHADTGQSIILVPIIIMGQPTNCTGGDVCDFTVTLNDTASSDQAVAVQTNQPSLFSNLPASVIVPAGSSSVTFSVMTNMVNSSTSANVTATLNNSAVSTSESVGPIQQPMLRSER